MDKVYQTRFAKKRFGGDEGGETSPPARWTKYTKRFAKKRFGGDEGGKVSFAGLVDKVYRVGFEKRKLALFTRRRYGKKTARTRSVIIKSSVLR